MRKVITDGEKELVVQQYLDKWPLRKIAAYASLSQTTVMKIVREAGVPLRGREVQYGPEMQATVQKLYDRGMSIADIMKQTGIQSGQTIYRLVKATRRNRGKKG